MMRGLRMAVLVLILIELGVRLFLPAYPQAPNCPAPFACPPYR